MLVRSYNGEIVKINKYDYASEKMFYIALWKIMYNIDISKNVTKFNIAKFI